ncbi:MAG: nitroreductase family protein [Clostridiales bacterium]|nr:nitroreductase family protein [Clostridiales bacterium]
MNQVLETIAARRSHRAYQPAQLTKEQLDAILKAALEAPSALNKQPWHYSVVQNQELLAQIHAAAKENAMKRDASQRSPRFNDEAFHIFYHAPTVIILSADPANDYAKIDCGIAVQTMALAAESLGLGSVILGLPKEAFMTEGAPELRKKLCFPEGNDYVIAIALGTPADDKPAHDIGEDKISMIL